MEASMLKLIHRAGSCENGPCPNLFDVAGDGREDMAAVQGATVTGSATAAHESVVLVPRRLVLEYAALIQGAELPGAGPQSPDLADVAGNDPEDPEDMVAIKGETMTDAAALAQLSEKPAYESVVLVPKRLIAEYAGRIWKEDMVDA
jgi:hypothetical protein